MVDSNLATFGFLSSLKSVSWGGNSCILTCLFNVFDGGPSGPPIQQENIIFTAGQVFASTVAGDVTKIGSSGGGTQTKYTVPETWYTPTSCGSSNGVKGVIGTLWRGAGAGEFSSPFYWFININGLVAAFNAGDSRQVTGKVPKLSPTQSDHPHPIAEFDCPTESLFNVSQGLSPLACQVSAWVPPGGTKISGFQEGLFPLIIKSATAGKNSNIQPINDNNFFTNKPNNSIHVTLYSDFSTAL